MIEAFAACFVGALLYGFGAGLLLETSMAPAGIVTGLAGTILGSLISGGHN